MVGHPGGPLPAERPYPSSDRLERWRPRLIVSALILLGLVWALSRVMDPERQVRRFSERFMAAIVAGEVETVAAMLAPNAHIRADELVQEYGAYDFRFDYIHRIGPEFCPKGEVFTAWWIDWGPPTVVSGDWRTSAVIQIAKADGAWRVLDMSVQGARIHCGAESGALP